MQKHILEYEEGLEPPMSFDTTLQVVVFAAQTIRTYEERVGLEPTIRIGYRITCFQDKLFIQSDSLHFVPKVGLEPTRSKTKGF